MRRNGKSVERRLAELEAQTVPGWQEEPGGIVRWMANTADDYDAFKMGDYDQLSAIERCALALFSVYHKGGGGMRGRIASFLYTLQGCADAAFSAACGVDLAILDRASDEEIENQADRFIEFMKAEGAFDRCQREEQQGGCENKKNCIPSACSFFEPPEENKGEGEGDDEIDA